MITFTRDGLGADPWCALAIHPQGWCAVWSQPGRVQFEFPTWLTITRAIPTDFLRYLDAVGDGAGHVAAIGVGADDVAYLVRSWTDGAMPLETVSGNFPVGIYWNGVDFVPVLVISDTRYKRGDTEADIPIGGTSQGVRQVLPDGTIRWGDNTHELTIHGRSIHKYSRADDVLAGQRNGPDHIDIYDSGWFTAITGSAQPPRVTRLLDGRYGICAATNHGAVFAIGPPWDPLLPDHVPPPPPPDPPSSPPEPPMILDTLKVARAKYPARRLTDRQLGALLNEVAWIHKADGILLYPKTAGTVAIQPRTDATISIDILLWRDPSGLLWWSDVLNDAEDLATPVEPHWLRSDQPNTWLAPVQPDGVIDPPPPPPPVDPPDDDRDDQQDADIVALRRDLAELRGRHDALLARVDALPTDPGDVSDVRLKVAAIEARMRKPVSTNRAFSHAHTVTLLPPGESL